ncbi:hypothetical protein GCM10023166_11870 [Paeniglutamicibacter cryotolerans]
MAADSFGRPGFYLRHAGACDAMASSRVYNRRPWGTRPGDYAAFAARAIGSSGGPLLAVVGEAVAAMALLHVAGRREAARAGTSMLMLDLAAGADRTASAGTCPPPQGVGAMGPPWVWGCCTGSRRWRRCCQS